ncbi:MAG: hypothetical protein D6706_04770 [Chloroflexi bacterium]|nr:MAG: hypothetical protein D6706_04770 [Chloroflexota bacterium]
MNFLLELHGSIRWWLLLIAVVALVRYGLGWQGKRPFQSLDRTLMTAFTGLLDLNLLLGLILIIFGGGLNNARIIHALTMLVAIIVAHATASWRKSGTDTVKFRNNLIVVIVVMVIVFIGVINLRGGWLF